MECGSSVCVCVRQCLEDRTRPLCPYWLRCHVTGVIINVSWCQRVSWWPTSQQSSLAPWLPPKPDLSPSPSLLPLLESSRSNLLVYTFPNSLRAGWPSSICVCGIKHQNHPKVPKVLYQLCRLVNLFSYWTLKALNHTSAWFGFAFVHWFFCSRFNMWEPWEVLLLNKKRFWNRNKVTFFRIHLLRLSISKMQGWYWHRSENISNNTHLLSNYKTHTFLSTSPCTPIIFRCLS